MSRLQSPTKLEENSMGDEERPNSSTMTATEPHSPRSADLPTEKLKLADEKCESELTIQSSLQVLGGFMLLFNSYL